MKILYLSALPSCEFDALYKNGHTLNQAAQKFNRLYIEGFCLNDCDCDVIFFNNNVNSGSYKEIHNNRTVTYITQNINGNKISKIFARKSFIKGIVKDFKNSEPNGIVVTDALSPLSDYLLKLAYKLKLNTVSIVTDLPEDLGKQKSLKAKVMAKLAANRFYGQFKYVKRLVVLAKGMLDKIPHKNATILNGICDYALKAQTEKPQKLDKKVIVYTGEIRKMYGIHNLVEAFISLHRDDAELWLYGGGMQFYPELQEMINKNPSVKYMGIKPNNEVVAIQKSATLLVNPRLTKGYGDYIKYSFPSKNIEYLVSATPLITTKLPAITEEYNEHLFFFEDESVSGMAKVLNDCLNMSKEELEDKGRKAKEFILNKLNNKLIAKSIIDFFK